MRIVLTGVLLILPLWAAADTLVLAGGDTLSGELLDIEADTVAFKTAYAGRTFLPADEVKTLSTSGWYEVTLMGGITLTARFEVRQGNQYLVTVPDSSTQIAVADILEARPAPSAPGEPPAISEQMPDLDAAAGVGILRRWGTLNRTGAFTWAHLQRETGAFRFHTHLQLAATDADTFPDWLDFKASWRFQPAEAWGPVLRLEGRRDADAGLAGSVEAGIGAEITAYESPASRLALSGGLSVSSAFYNSDLIYRLRGEDPNSLESILHHAMHGGASGLDAGIRALFDTQYYEDRRKYSETDAALYWGLRYDQSLFGDRATLSEELQVRPSLTRWGDLTARSESVVQVPITRSLSMRLQINLDYDNDPPFRRLDNFRSSVGAGIEFGF
jgi:hypothetical protein